MPDLNTHEATVTAGPVVLFGDVHGESKQLAKLIELAKDRYGEDVEFYSLGDLIDRGPDSAGVVDLCIEHNIKGIVGNHELWLRHFAQTGMFDQFALAPVMGGEATLLSYGVTNLTSIPQIEEDLGKAMPESHRTFLANLPLWRRLEVDGQVYRLVHAGVKKDEVGLYRDTAKKFEPNFSLSEEDALVEVMALTQQTTPAPTRAPDPLLWRGPRLWRGFNLYKYKDGATQVFGHVPQQSPRVNKNWMALDTGCGTCHPYWLSAVVLPHREVISIGQFGEEIPDYIRDAD